MPATNQTQPLRHILTLDQDIVVETAKHLVNHSRLNPSDTLACDFSQQTVLCPSQAIGRKLAQAIASAAKSPGILSPRVMTVPQWAQSVAPYATNSLQIQIELSQWVSNWLARQPPESSWLQPSQAQAVAAELQHILSEFSLSLHPASEFAAFLQQVSEGYGIPLPDSFNPDLLSPNQPLSQPLNPSPNQHSSLIHTLIQETKLVHAAWQRFGESHFHGYPQALATAVSQQQAASQLPWLVGFDTLSPLEQALLSPCPQITYQSGSLDDAHNKLKHQTNDITTHSLRTELTQQLLATTPHIQQRATALTSAHFSNIELAACDDLEHEAWAACTQIRLWLAEDVRAIAVVAEDREFARRLRALLERYQIDIADRGGWALATTSAATLLERWLQVVEEDAPAVALLDVLHSAFIDPAHLLNEGEQNQATSNLAHTTEPASDTMHATFSHVLYRLEEDIIHHEGITQGLVHYQRAVERRQQRLAELWPQTTAPRLFKLLTTLQQASNELQPLLHKPEFSAAEFAAALTASLQQLGALSLLAHDPAGVGVMECIQLLSQTTVNAGINPNQANPNQANPEQTHQSNSQQINWQTARQLLNQCLEDHDYRPAHGATSVVLCNLNQAYLEQPQAVILAAATASNLPGTLQHSRFFNNRVRRHLSLMDRESYQAIQQHRFARLLCNSPKLLISWSQQNDGNPELPCAWVEQLQALRHCVTSTNHQATALPLLEWARLEAAQQDRQTPPEASEWAVAPTTQPAPSLNETPFSLPSELSVSGHQNLIDCPYQFLYGRIIGLRAPEDIRLALAKNEFGARVHRCLEAFTTGIDGIPGPFTDQLTANTRATAKTLLIAIGAVVFARDTAHNAWDQGWQMQYEALLDGYLNWEQNNHANWHWLDSESKHQVAITASTQLIGRLDRRDQHRNDANQQTIIDYKTSANLPSASDVYAGEQVQLPSYTLLSPAATAVEYVHLSKTRRQKLRIEQDELEHLSKLTENRLQTSLDAILAGAVLPAHGDEAACAYCDFAGICRQAVWRQTEPAKTDSDDLQGTTA